MKALLLSAVVLGVVGGLQASELRAVSASADSSPSKPLVQKGMSAEAVIGLIGKPRETKPIEAEGVRAESWIYRRVAKRVVNQVAPTVEKVPTWGGLGIPGDGIIEVDVPFNRIERVTIYQMTALLFVDGKVVASKQWFERSNHFD